MSKNWRLNRDMRLRDRAIEMLNSLAVTAPEFGYTHEEIMNRYDTIHAMLKVTRQSVRSYVSGYSARIREEWYRRDLVFAHVGPDGQRYTGHKDIPWALSVDPLYKANRGGEIAKWPNAHFWKKSGKPYSAIEPFKTVPPAQLSLEMA